MGLSNEERLKGLFYDINNMVSKADAIKDKSDHPRKLIEFTDQLWYVNIDTMDKRSGSIYP
jgi:hypothetical protein